MKEKRDICFHCDLFDPHEDDRPVAEVMEKYKQGLILKTKDNCAIWLCGSDKCPIKNTNQGDK